MFLKRMTKTQLFAFVRDNDVTTVFLSPRKMRFDQYQAYRVELTTNSNNDVVTVKNGPSGYPQAFDVMYNAWAYYNTSYETGYYAHYYVAVEWEFQTQTFTGTEWEPVDYNLNKDSALRSLNTYRENQPNQQHRLIRKLVSYVYS